jgi:hypothetical protein
MSSKARRRRPRASGDATEVAVRTGSAPKPGEVIGKKRAERIVSNRDKAVFKATAAVDALSEQRFGDAGRLFHEASQAANLANAEKMKS